MSLDDTEHNNIKSTITPLYGFSDANLFGTDSNGNIVHIADTSTWIGIVKNGLVLSTQYHNIQSSYKEIESIVVNKKIVNIPEQKPDYDVLDSLMENKEHIDYNTQRFYKKLNTIKHKKKKNKNQYKKHKVKKSFKYFDYELNYYLHEDVLDELWDENCGINENYETCFCCKLYTDRISTYTSHIYQHDDWEHICDECKIYYMCYGCGCVITHNGCLCRTCNGY